MMTPCRLPRLSLALAVFLTLTTLRRPAADRWWEDPVDQAPHDSMESGLTSCIGWSILLIDACRARSAFPPGWWAPQRDHQTWVEVWDGDSIVETGRSGSRRTRRNTLVVNI